MKLDNRKNHFAAQQQHKTSQLTTISTKHLIIIADGHAVTALCDAVEMDCVRVSRYDARPVLISHTNSSLRLRLSPWQPPGGCGDTSFPSVNYTIYYRPVDAPDPDVICAHPQAACSHKVKQLNIFFVDIATLTLYRHNFVSYCISNKFIQCVCVCVCVWFTMTMALQSYL